MGGRDLGFWMLGWRILERIWLDWRVGYWGIFGFWSVLGFCFERKEEKMKSTRERGLLFFWVGLRMPRHSLLNAAALRSRPFKQILGSGLNAAALGTQCCGIEGSVSKIFFLVWSECRGIGLWMPQHWAYWLSTFFSSLMSMPRHGRMNAAALVLLPKPRFSLLFECRGIGDWMLRHWALGQNECRGIEPCFCIPLLLHFSTLFLLIFWPEQPMNHKMKEINEK